MAAKQEFYQRGVKRAHALAGPTVADGAGYWQDAAASLARLRGVPLPELLAEVTAFHRERLESVPDLTLYPELRGYRDLLEAEESGMRDEGLSEVTIALAQSLNFWRDTRLVEQTGRAWHAPVLVEKCRVLYVPESDQGALHFKNIDDPITFWRPHPEIGAQEPWPHSSELVFDGVGSGLHLDEMPPEIFPVNAKEMARDCCHTVAEAEEFLVRYNYFWSSANLLVHDHQGNSVAFEKTRCRVATRKAIDGGINFITGMGALDPGISAFQKMQRQKYLDQCGTTWDDSPDGCFWTVCEGTWRNMTRYVAELAQNPTWDNAKQLMEQRDKSGPMCRTGQKSHPKMGSASHTLIMNAYQLDKRVLHRRQWRGARPAYLDTPEIVQYT